jgi:thioredoxin-like negative regulator of GroEL
VAGGRGGAETRGTGDRTERGSRRDAPTGGFGPFAKADPSEARRPARDEPRVAPSSSRRAPAKLRLTRSEPAPPKGAGRRGVGAGRSTRKPPPVASRRTRRRRGPDDVRDEIVRLGGRTGERSYQRLVEAADAFANDRERDAARLLKPLRDAMPSSPSVRELYGLALYRLGRYADAAKELDAFVGLTGEVTQHPVLMDTYRALGNRDRVNELWRELGEASPSAELVTEGRIVLAGMLADRGDLDRALTLLRRRVGDVRKARDHHLRLWYALADLEERAGNLPDARVLFQRVARQDPAFADVAERLVSLR